MKFKLVEEFNSGLYNKSTIDTLNEGNVIKSEIAHILSAIVNNKSNPSGYISHLKRKNKDIIIKIKEYCNNHNITDDVFNEWEAHHINGLHPQSFSEPDNSLSNIAFVEKNLHKEITKINRELAIELYAQMFANSNASGEIGAIISHLVAKCIAEGIAPSTYLKSNVNIAKELIKILPQKLAEKFDSIYDNNKDKIILLSQFI